MAEEKVDLAEGNESVTETKEEVTETPEQKIERLEVENKNLRDGNSKLGREFKYYKEDMTGKYDEILNKVSQLSAVPQKTTEESLSDYEDEEMKRLRKIAREEAQRDREDANSQYAAAREKYVNDYTKKIQELGRDEAPEVYEAIAEGMKNLPGYSNDGTADAERNYEKAERNYYKSMAKGNKTTTAFKGQDPKGTKTGGSSTIATKDTTDEDVSKAMKDPHVQAYLSRRKKDRKFVEKALKNKTPMSGTMRI